MRKIRLLTALIFVVILSVCAACFSGCNGGSDSYDGLTFKLIEEKKDGKVVDSYYSVALDLTATEPIVDLVIPSKYNDKLVKNVAVSGFNNCSTLESVVIPKTVVKIGASAFSACLNLKEVTFQGQLTLGDNAFAYCRSLERVSVPADAGAKNSTTGIVSYSMGKGVFQECSALESVDLSEANVLGASAFYNCTSLTEVNIPKSLTDIPASCFAGCTALEDVSLPDELVSIGQEAFYGCTSLEEIDLPDEALASIGLGAFGACPLESISVPFVGGKAASVSASATNVFGYIFGSKAYVGSNEVTQTYGKGEATYYLPETLTKVEVSAAVIPAYAFSNCQQLTEIEFETTVTVINDYAFINCSGLTEIEITKGITDIGNGAFANCVNLNEISLPSTLTSLGGNVFEGTTWLSSQQANSENGMVIFNSILIDASACSGNIDLPDSVNVISFGAFKNCTINSISLPFVGGSETSDNYFGYIFGDVSATVEDSLVPETLKSVTITAAEEIKADAFSGSTYVESIVLGDSIQVIRRSAFANCTSLTSITLPSSLEEIGNQAFVGCTSLTEIVIPESVEKLGYGLFNGCTSLEKATLLCDADTVGLFTFYGCSALTEVTLPSSLVLVDASAFEGCTSLTTVNFDGNWSEVTVNAKNDSLLALIG